MGIFREYRNKCFWRPKCFGKGTTSVYAVAEIKWPFLDSIEISASEDLNALEKAPPQIMPLQILSWKGAVQIMPFRKLGRKCHFLLRFCTRKRSETYRSGTLNSNTVNSKFHLIRSFLKAHLLLMYCIKNLSIGVS